jgi:hypothetical protein
MEHVTSDEDWLFWETRTKTHTHICNCNTSWVLSDNQRSESVTEPPFHDPLSVLLSYYTAQHTTSNVKNESVGVNFYLKHFVDILVACYHLPFCLFFVIISLFSFSCTHAFGSESIMDIFDMINPRAHEFYPLISWIIIITNVNYNSEYNQVITWSLVVFLAVESAHDSVTIYLTIIIVCDIVQFIPILFLQRN